MLMMSGHRCFIMIEWIDPVVQRSRVCASPPQHGSSPHGSKYTLAELDCAPTALPLTPRVTSSLLLRSERLESLRHIASMVAANASAQRPFSGGGILAHRSGRCESLPVLNLRPTHNSEPPADQQCAWTSLLIGNFRLSMISFAHTSDHKSMV